MSRPRTYHDATTLWAWVTEVPGEGVSQVGAFVPELRVHMTLVARDREVAENLRPIAQRHARDSGQRVWLREYTGSIDHGDA